MLFIAAVAQFFCGMASVTANSRMSFAFSRDNALPGSRLWKKVNHRTGTPTNSIWFCVFWSAVLTLPALWSLTAYFAVTSIAVIGLYIAYVTPVFLRRINPDFRRGPWHLGRWSAAIGWISVVWVIFIVVLFMLPQYAPGTFGDPTFNYAPVAVAVVLAFSTATWFIGGRKHFMHSARDEYTTKDLDDIFAEEGADQARAEILAEDE
jgi:amino acid transporter